MIIQRYVQVLKNASTIIFVFVHTVYMYSSRQDVLYPSVPCRWERSGEQESESRCYTAAGLRTKRLDQPERRE